MSENDFQSINQNQYRGSRYSSFVGGGTDSAGNVTAAGSENTSNTVASSNPSLPQNQNVNVNQSILGNTNVSNPVLSGSSGSVVTSGLQAVAPTVGARVGANLALGSGIEGSLSGVGSDIAGRVSSGLLSSSTSGVATNAALSSMGSKLGPATASSVGKASSGASMGGAAGSGIAAAAVTLLTGGSVKDAIFSGGGAYLGSLAGTAAGAAIGGTIGSVVPVVGTIIGSWLGSKLGGLFGGDVDYPYARADINVKDGKAYSKYEVLDGFKTKDIAALGDATSSVIQKFIDATGSKNISGPKATIGYQQARSKKHKLNQSGFFAGGRGDFNTGATYQGLKTSQSAVESSVKDWLKTASFNDAPDKQGIIQSGLTNNMSLDDIYSSLTGTYNAPTIVKPRQATFYS